MKLSRWFLLFIFAAVLYGNLTVFAQEKDSDELLETVDDVIQTVERVRELDFNAPIRKGVRTRAEIASYIHEQFRKEYSQEELQLEGKILRKLGFIPATIDYEAYLIKLLMEQVGGYYDQEKKMFIIASWLSSEEQKPVMMHELAHALQDQHFNIGKILEDDRRLNNNDRAQAHQALLEGDAMVVMLQSEIESIQRHFSELPDLGKIMQLQMGTTQAQYAVFREAPVFIQQNLLFPYGYGASFLQKAWKNEPGWQFINNIYSDLPSSTEQILHPEKYFGVRDEPKPVKPMDLLVRLGDDWGIAYRNVLGEFSLGLLLNLHLTEEHSQKSVSGWGGDQVLYLENQAGQDAAFINTVWDTEEDAEKFFMAMDAWFGRRYPDAKRKTDTSTVVSLVQDKELHEMRLEGNNLYIMIGLPEEDGRKWTEN